MPKNHVVYFEFFGKKMRTTVLADTLAEATQKVRDKVIIKKVVVKPNDAFNTIAVMADEIIGHL